MKSLCRFALLFSPLVLSSASYAQNIRPGAAPRSYSRTKSLLPASMSYPRLEASFSLPNLQGDPFDWEKTDVRAQIRRVGGGTLSVPAFFDGNETWRVRHTPTAPGRYEITGITLNGQAVKTAALPRTWDVKGAANARLPGLMRITADKSRFAFANGAPYYPLGHNQAWRTGGLPDIPQLFDKMGAAGENWSRVWMNHWDNKNLDWTPKEGAPAAKPGEFGTLSLDVARRWDAIVSAAERNGIAFQLVFQHHGQYSSQVNPNWGENPYNLKNGGFLPTPNEFFTNAQAKNLTKRKLRYSVARWGYSPSILAWELFNEVQFTDAGRAKEWDAVAKWHREMADFLRQQDPYDHLITTSSAEGVPLGIWERMDFYQTHAYPSDVVTALYGATQPEGGPRKPFFIGEYGPSEVQDPTGIAIHNGLWAGMMSNQAGAPQFWTWDDVERGNFYFHFGAAAGFVKASGLPGKTGLAKVIPVLTTSEVADLSFGPGGGWGDFKQSEFVVDASGPPPGIGEMPRYFQGQGHREMMPKPLTFRVNYPRGGQFVLEVNEVALGGARLILEVDGQKIERDFPAAAANYKPQDDARRIAIAVPAGARLITVQNTGSDWAVVGRITLTDYTSALGAYALAGRDYSAAWVYHRENIARAPGKESRAAASGQITLPKLAPGRYRATWWDTLAGKPLSTSPVVVGAAPLSLSTPSVLHDVGLFLIRENQ